MSEIFFGWVGESRRTALRSLLAAEVAGWSHDWWIHHAAAEVDVYAKSRARDVGVRETLPWVSSNESGSIAFDLAGKDIDAVGRHLAGAVSDEDTDWARHIGQDALENLATRIHERAGSAKFAKLSRLSASDGLVHARLGAYTATIALGSLKLDLAIDRQLVDRLVPPRAITGMNLVSRQDALGNAPLQIHAVMDFGAVNLTHLSDLRVGEIIAGDRALDEPLEIYVEGNRSVATGYLRRSGMQRAVMLGGINSQERHTS
jgi:hypothetical protein